MNYTATYSPDDNKLRLYASSRLDAETFARVKAAGFKWAPKQDLFVAPAWSPSREDLLIELAGEIEDEDKSLVARAEERAERFEDYSDKRAAEAAQTSKAVDQIAERFWGGQPILVGHHSEKRARKDQERIHNGMRKAIKLWDQSGYWKSRAAGSLAAAKYKELPAVRARRIKKIESDLRKTEKAKATNLRELAAWEKIRGINDPDRQHKAALMVANHSGYWSMSFPLADFPRDPPASQYEGPMGIWSALDGGVITAPKACEIIIPKLINSLPRLDRWIAHYENRLAYERAMLAESGGTLTDRTKPEVGGAIRWWRGWAYITKVNKVTLTVREKANYGDRYFRHNVDMTTIKAIMTKAEVEAARAEGRLIEKEDGTGFSLVTAPDPAPEPPPAPEADPTAEKIAAMKDAVRNGGVKVVVADQLFPTPRDLADRMIDLAGIDPGHDVLEPSAGTGMLIGAMGGRPFGPGGGSITAVEINPTLVAGLREHFPLTTVHSGDFLDLAGNLGRFDRIVMNPPFGNAADIKHVTAAAALLAEGGRLVAICANGPRQNDQLKPLASYWEPLPAGTFAGTNVNSVLMVIEK